jgi:hypothetical protein
MSMKMRIPQEIEKYRFMSERSNYSTKTGDEFGAFHIPVKKGSVRKFLIIVAPIKNEWQHVSVSLQDRCPTWAEMCMIKDLFWDKEEVVIQIHPKESEYVNNHKYCLHLWAHKDLITPPSIFVGVRQEK